MFVFRRVRNRSFARSRQGRLYGDPKHAYKPLLVDVLRRIDSDPHLMPFTAITVTVTSVATINDSPTRLVRIST
jgi:hypothetical protein